ncbi:MAG TPA: AAA family ATPase [Ktedonobacteraceae bacterium]|nr:AAA family ATPase [Ktedonobacteraceae bacterium]
MKRYLPAIKQYSWILLVCVVLSSGVGLYIAKSIPPAFQVSATILVQTGSPGTSITSLTSSTDPTQSLAEANTYASEIPTREVMIFIYNHDPAIGKRGFQPDDLLNDDTAVASTTSATVAITATATSRADAVFLANHVADGFILYSQQQSQDALNTLRKGLTDQLATYQQKQQQLQASLVKIGNTNDPNYIFTNNSLNSVNTTINNLQSQLLNLPLTVRSDVSVVQHAEEGDAVAASKTSIVVAATAAVGLLVGILIMMLMIFLDDRLRDEAQVQNKLGIAYLGSVTTSGALAAKPTQPSGESLAEIGNIYAGLKLTGLKTSQWQAPRGGVLLVTSAQEAEGKTTIAAALAANFANAGGSVVVVDGNLRKPGTHIAFNMGASADGLSSALRSSSNVDDVVKRSNVPGVWVMPAGAPIGDPTILLEQKLPSILTQMRNKTDIIIIDGPALLSNADALLLATMSDCVMMVVDVRHDKMAYLLRAKELLSSLAKIPSGVIMNRAPRRKRNKFYATASVVNTTATPETVVSAQNHNGNGHNGSNGQKSEPLVMDMPPVRTSPPSFGGVPLTPAGRVTPTSTLMEPPSFGGGMQYPLSNPGNMPELPLPLANNQPAMRPPARPSVAPPSPSRIPPSPSRPE